MRASEASYRAPRWLPGGHLQTLYAAMCAPHPRTRFRRERWDTPDGDFIDLDWIENPGFRNRDSGATPLVVLFHGLEGGSRAQYAHSLMAEVARANWNGVVVHFRSCSGEPNRLRRAYHSGDSAEIDWILRRLKASYGAAPLYVVGISLGGNVLLKWLGKQRENAQQVLAAAAAVSAPVDLLAAGNALDAGFNLIYTRNFLVTMKRKTLAKLERFPDLCDRRALLAARTLREFDNIVTAPLHGYRDTDDYWTRASSKPWLSAIAAPTLVLNARNDPFLPAAALPRHDEVSPSVMLELPPTGGHVGFVAGSFPGRLDWLPKRLMRFFSSTG